MQVTFPVFLSYLDFPAFAYKGISLGCQKIRKLAKDVFCLLAINSVCGISAVLFLPPAKSVVPLSVSEFFDKVLTRPISVLRDKIINLLPAINTTFTYNQKLTTNWMLVAVAGTTEEVVFRYGIQTLLLTELPRRIIKAIRPASEHLVDHSVAKVARIAITALVFTLCHTSRMGHLPGMLLPQLVAGIYFSYRREQGASIVHLSALHIVYNIAGAILGGGLTSEPPKLS